MLYDGECPLCMREVNFLRRRDAATRGGAGGAIDFVDIADPTYDAARNAGLDYATAMGEIHAILPDGSVVTKARCFFLVAGHQGTLFFGCHQGTPVNKARVAVETRLPTSSEHWVFGTCMRKHAMLPRVLRKAGRTLRTHGSGKGKFESAFKLGALSAILSLGEETLRVS